MDPTLTRRAVLAGGLGLAAGAIAGCSQQSQPGDGEADDDAGPSGSVLVVGAGLAGLTAALDLAEAGWQVTVVEARDRVGGRVMTWREPFSEGLHAEAGGESIDVDHQALLALVERFDLHTEDRPGDKIIDGIVWWRGTRRRTSEFIALNDGEVGQGYERFYSALDALADGIDPDHPERAANAAELDAATMAELIDGLDLSPETRLLVETDVRSSFNTEPDQISQLFVAQQSAVGTDISDEGVEAMRIAGGNDQLPIAIAAALRADPNVTLVLGAAVSAIDWNDEGATVHFGDQAEDVDHLVLACPMEPLRDVEFSPPLPATLAAAVASLALGQATKVSVEYERPFWQELELSGFTVSDEPFGVAWSPTDSYENQRGLLTAFVTGDAAADAAKLADTDRIESVGAQLDTVYPEGAQGRQPGGATIAWTNEQYTGGGYAVFGPGQITGFRAEMLAGVGPIYFAGEHTEALAGYMESAVRSGHRVANEIGLP